MRIYNYDSDGAFTGIVKEVDEKAVIPVGFTHKEPIEGFFFSGASWKPIAPAIEVPTKVTKRQAKQQLVLAGLYPEIQIAIDAIEDATQKMLMQIYWDDSQEFERHHEQLIGLGYALGLTDADIDQLFIEAAKL